MPILWPMTKDVQRLPQSKATIKGSLTPEEFAVYIEKATEAFVKEAELPGFRKGKAPKDLVASRIGDGKILEEAASLALNAHYPKILEEEKLNVIGRPDIKITKLARGNPFEWEAECSLLPEVTLPDYKDIAKKHNAKPVEDVIVTDEEVEKSLEWLQKSRAKKEGDTETLPELNDEFAASVGKFKTLDELKNAIRENAKHEKEEKEHDKNRIELVQSIVDGSTMDIPDILVESEKDKMLAELQSSVTSMGLSWDQYLAHAKKTEEDLRKDWDTDAKKRAAFGLVLREIAQRENLKPSEAELDTWADRYIRAQDAETQRMLDRERVKDYAYGILRNEQVFAFLKNIT